MKIFLGIKLCLFMTFSNASAQVDTASLYRKFNATKGRTSQHMEIMFGLADMHKFTPDSMLKYASSGNRLATSLKDQQYVAKFSHLLAVAQLNKSDFKSALSAIDRSIAINQLRSDRKSLGRTLKIRAVIRYYQGDYEASISDFSQAIEEFDASGYRIDLPTCYTYLAELFRRNENEELGYQYDQKAYDVARELDLQISKSDPDRDIVELNLIQTTGNLADHFGKKGAKKTELRYLYQALAKSNHKKYYPTYLVYLGNAAECEYKLGNQAKGKAMALQARSLARTQGQQRAEANAQVKLMMMARNAKEMYSYHDPGLRLAKAIGNDQLIGNFYLIRAEMLEQFGDYKTALLIHKRYVDMTDSLSRDSQRDRISKMETAFRLKENTYRLLESENLNLAKDFRIKTYFWLTVLLAAATIISVALSLYIWNLSKRVKRQHQALTELNDFKNVMMNVIGHDVSGMLSAMGSLLYLIADGQPEDDQRSSDISTLTILRQEAYELLVSLMVWAEQGAKRVPSNRNLVVELLEPDLRTIINMSKFYKSKLITHIEPVDTDLPSPYFRFIVRNLVLNAMKYSPEASTVSLAISQEDGKLLVRVRNETGRVNLQRLRQLFDGTAGSSIRQTDGAALALKLSISLAEANGGKLEFEETGPVVRITLILPAENGQS